MMVDRYLTNPVSFAILVTDIRELLEEYDEGSE